MPWESRSYTADVRNFDDEGALDEDLRITRVRRDITYGVKSNAQIAYDICQKQAHKNRIQNRPGNNQSQGPRLEVNLSSRGNFVAITFSEDGDARVEWKRGAEVNWDLVEEVLKPLRNAEVGF